MRSLLVSFCHTGRNESYFHNHRVLSIIIVEAYAIGKNELQYSLTLRGTVLHRKKRYKINGRRLKRRKREKKALQKYRYNQIWVIPKTVAWIGVKKVMGGQGDHVEVVLSWGLCRARGLMARGMWDGILTGLKENEVHWHNEWVWVKMKRARKQDDRTRTKSNAFHVTRMASGRAENEKDTLEFSRTRLFCACSDRKCYKWKYRSPIEERRERRVWAN